MHIKTEGANFSNALEFKFIKLTFIKNSTFLKRNGFV